MKQVIFIHIPKTAGTSIFNAMNHFRRILIHDNTNSTQQQSEYTFTEGQLQKQNLNIHPLITFGHGHLPDIIKFGYITEERFNKSFKFCFVRNPWDRFVSLYSYLLNESYPHIKGRMGADFTDFCNSLDSIEPISRFNVRGLSQFNPQSDWITGTDGQSLVDFIGRYESLQTDLNRLMDIIERPQVTLIVANKGIHAEYKTYYNDKTREIVGAYYKDDIDNFGYKF